MYPKRTASSPSGNARDLEKMQKQEQLMQLLVNKFRNKFRVSMSDQAEIDSIIKYNVATLITSGNMTEKNLRELDVKLEKEIQEYKQRAHQDKSSRRQGSVKEADKNSSAGGYKRIEQASQRSQHASQHSQRSLGEKNSRLGLSGQHVIKNTGKSLQIGDDEWNNLVQQNLAKFNKEKEQVKKEREAKNRALQQEQMR